MSLFSQRNLHVRQILRQGLLFTLIVSCLYTATWADPVGPRREDHQITNTVIPMLRGHLSRHPLDKEIAARWMKMYLKSLDPIKVYFYQSDVDEFTKHQDELIELIRKNDITLAYVVFQRFLQRVDERLKTIDEVLAQPQDFTLDEEMVIDRDELQYPKDPSEAQERWRKRIKYDLLLLKTNKDNKDKKEGKEAIEKLTKRYHSIVKRWHQTSAEDLLEIYLNSLTTSLDPHTNYMSPDTAKNFDITMRLELDGIGAQLLSEDGYTMVKELVPGGAADKDGRLKVDDKIVGVGEGEDGPMVDVIDMKINDVVKLIRGPRGKVVRLEVLPPGDEKKILKITREKIELKDKEAKGEIFEVGTRPDGAPIKSA